jgi:hypothetical protein
VEDGVGLDLLEVRQEGGVGQEGAVADDAVFGDEGEAGLLARRPLEEADDGVDGPVPEL